jgi:hypothetical protein
LSVGPLTLVHKKITTEIMSGLAFFERYNS